MPKKDTVDKKGNRISYFSFAMSPEMSSNLDSTAAALRLSKKDLVVRAIQFYLDRKDEVDIPDNAPAKIYAAFDDVEELKKQVAELKEHQAYMRKMLDTIFLKSDFMDKT